MHRDVANQIRGTLKTFGLVLGKVAAGAFEARVRQLIAGNPLLVTLTLMHNEEPTSARWRADAAGRE